MTTEKLTLWEKLAREGSLPAWEAIPDFGLYMDQVITLLEQYLSFLPDRGEQTVTSSAINNYVRLKIMPAPVKRKYYRVHLAYLMMILPMKQSVAIADIPRILPPGSDQEAVRAAYEDYTRQFCATAEFFRGQVAALMDDLEDGAGRAALQSVLIASFARILTAQLILPQED